MTHSGRMPSMPFIVTFAASAIACGGSATFNEFSEAGAGGASSSASGVGQGPTSSVSVGTGGSNPSNCPATPPTSWEQCELGLDEVCSYAIACQSGQRTIDFQCADYGYWFTAGSCDHHADSCPGTELYCSGGTWYMPEGTNPPAPCPADKPEAGSECFAGGWGGGTWEQCGYSCFEPGAEAWTIATCAPSADPGEDITRWQFDDACHALGD